MKDHSVDQLKSVLNHLIPELDIIASNVEEPPYDNPKVQKSAPWSPRLEFSATISDKSLSQAVIPFTNTTYFTSTDCRTNHIRRFIPMLDWCT